MRKGFTLIELLAVIVILAIIALIATPIVLSIIKDSKESANLRSAELYIDSVEYAIADIILDNKIIKDGKHTVLENGNICIGTITNNVCSDEMKVEVNGETPKSGRIEITNGKITGVKLEYSNDFVYIDKTYYNGEVVYFDVEKGKGCSEEDYDVTNSNTGYNGYNNKTSAYDTTLTDKLETQNSCLKFYAFNDNESEKVNLLLDHNTTDVIAWNLSASNTLGPKEIMTQLALDTGDWKGTQTSTNYKVVQTTGGNYEIDYSKYKARLITANEIAEITTNETFSESTVTTDGWYYFDSKTNIQSTICKSGDTSGCKYGWLYDRTSSNCKDSGCLNNSDTVSVGYWTSTSVTGVTDVAWYVRCSSSLSLGDVGSSVTRGLRPVIEVLKNKL